VVGGEERAPAFVEHRIVWRFADGTEDAIERRCFLRTAEYEGERFAAGETLTRCSEGVAGRFSRAGVPARAWRVAGLLEGRGDAGRRIRQRLLEAVPALVEGRGLRDAGDYRRSGAVWTNLEFDTTLGLARLGLCEGQGDLLERAWRAAIHVADRDLDPRTGLCFQHGKEHRTAAPDPGHTWLQGVLLVGCLAADEDLIATAGRIARGIAMHPVDKKGRDDRVRDTAWPLQEMEAWLRFAPDERVEQACDRLVARLLRRLDLRQGVLRFGEGIGRRGVYEDPLWVTAGCLLPGLRSHLRRTGDPRVRALIDTLEQRILELVRAGLPGLPLRYRVAGGRVFGVVRVTASASGFLLLEGLSEPGRRRCLERSLVRDALGELPRSDDPDLATTWSMVARCAWIHR
jgi:hypothetical protein